MDKFSLSNNREEIDFNLFKDKLKLSDAAGNQKIVQIFKLFDTDGNGILESTNSQGTNEIQSLLKGMSKYAANNKNSIFESNEVQQYLNETTDSEGNTLASKNISINDIFNFLKILKKTRLCNSARSGILLFKLLPLILTEQENFLINKTMNKAI